MSFCCIVIFKQFPHLNSVTDLFVTQTIGMGIKFACQPQINHLKIIIVEVCFDEPQGIFVKLKHEFKQFTILHLTIIINREIEAYIGLKRMLPVSTYWRAFSIISIVT